MPHKLILALFFVIASTHCYGQDDIFQKVFGNREIQGDVDLVVQGKSLGDIKIKLVGQKPLAIESKKLEQKLQTLLKPNYFALISLQDQWTKVEKLPYKVIYDPVGLKLEVQIPLEQLTPVFYSLDYNPRIKYMGEALSPAPLGAGLTLSADQTYADTYFGGDTFSLSYNSFVNFHGFVLNHQGYYLDNETDNRDPYWFRGNTNLTKDFVDQRTRVVLGDYSTHRFGFMRSSFIGGLTIHREFTIDPYLKPYPQGGQEFILKTRSRVKTFVNGMLTKDELLPPGNYQLGNLPLINGLNYVRLEVIDDTGQRTFLEFELPTSIGILRKGEWNYSLSSGRRYFDSPTKRDYSDTEVSSGFLQYGFSDTLSVGGYSQLETQFSQLGYEIGKSTLIGNFFLGSAYSDNEAQALSGQAHSLSWQYQNIGGELLAGSSLITTYEYYIDDFRASSLIIDNSLKDNIEGSISFPLYNRISFNIGAGYARYQDDQLPARKLFRTSLNWRIKNDLALNLFASTVDVNGQENENLSAFLTWSFSESNRYFTAFRDAKNNSTRVSLTGDNSNKLYSTRYTVSAEQTQDVQRADGRLLYPTPMADLEVRGTKAQQRQGSEEYKQVSARVATSLLFAYDKGAAFGIARPNNSSFALFKPSKQLEDQQIRLKSTSPYADTESPLIGDLGLTNLVSYQYREIQIDPTSLDDGFSLKKEKYVLLPGYHTAHLVKLENRGIISVKGILTLKGKPLALKVGRVGDNPFFTDRDGKFFIDGIQEKSFTLVLHQYGKRVINLKANQNGIIELGEIEIGN